MSETALLVEALWAGFRPEIATGDPVSFCFHEELVRDLLTQAGIQATSPLETICQAARSLLTVDGHDVLLHDDALQPIDAGLSAAIILVCQQVLAVEGMIRDRSASENAYFPRLRHLISPSLGHASENPFFFDDFERIWKVFRREIRSLKGSSEATVTFEFGVYRHRDKARQFPLSQALLSRADLIEVVTRCRQGKLRESNLSEVWREIRRARSALSRRGQQLVNGHLLRDQITRQVRGFAQRYSGTSIPGGGLISTKDFELRVALDSSDWMQQEYRPYLVRKGRDEATGDEAQIQEKVRALLSPQQYAVLVPSDSEEYWVLRQTEYNLSPGETALIVGTEQGIRTAYKLLAFAGLPLELETKRQPLAGEVTAQVSPLAIDAAMSHAIRISSGAIKAAVTSNGSSLAYEWLGGICVNTRARKYLRDALPLSVRFGTDEYDIAELVRVGDRSMSYESLLKEIGKLEEEDAHYSLRYPNGKVAKLVVGIRRFPVIERYGFPIDANGAVTPFLHPVGESDAALVGFSEPWPPIVRPAQVREVASLMRDLLAGHGRLLTDEEKEDVLERVSSAVVPRAVKRAVQHLLGGVKQRG